MEATEFITYFKWAELKEIRFFAVPYNSTGTVLKVAIEKKGQISVGEEKFKPETVATKITELYKQLYFKNNKQNETKK